MISPRAQRTAASRLCLALSLLLACWLALPSQASSSSTPPKASTGSPASMSYETGLAEFRSGNYMAAYKDLSAAAKGGDANAQQLLGHMYYMGTGVAQDFAQALAWHRKAAAQGLAESQYVIGTMYYSGKSVALDYREALQWFRKAGEHGHSDAQYMLGAMYFTGKGIPQDYKSSVAWFQRAAEQGHAEAQRLLGLLHMHGVGGVPQDNVIAYMLWNLSAATGNAEAQNLRDEAAHDMSEAQIAEGQALSSKWQVNTPLPTRSASGS
ncbi:MAG: sel1 repeat family protein [Burkholderiaceae bacterium]|nr:sel1 repeat family protein [Burkholderiaceae bacterium]